MPVFSPPPPITKSRAASLAGGLNKRNINACRGVQLAPFRGVTYSHHRILSHSVATLITLAVTDSSMPAVHVTDGTKAQLDTIKDSEGHTSYDSVVKSLLQESDRV
jgi:hypothetical protein